MKTAEMTYVPLLAFLFSIAQASTQADIESLLNCIETAYSAVMDYQAEVEVRTYWNDTDFETKKFLYTFKKDPIRIRIDFAEPYPGMVIVYPDKGGRAIIQPLRWAKSLKLHLSPDSALLTDRSGQTLDQTDLGALIRNMSRSLTDERRGSVEIDTRGAYIEVGVLADDHFREGFRTRYRFLIDKKSWLPAGVEEWTPDHTQRRRITFRDLRINIGISEDFFNLNGG
jgi:outer membrane lipoprotein-sorting protein